MNLPGGQHILIDAKVPLVAFEAYLGAMTEDDRAAAALPPPGLAAPPHQGAEHGRAVAPLRRVHSIMW